MKVRSFPTKYPNIEAITLPISSSKSTSKRHLYVNINCIVGVLTRTAKVRDSSSKDIKMYKSTQTNWGKVLLLHYRLPWLSWVFYLTWIIEENNSMHCWYRAKTLTAARIPIFWKMCSKKNWTLTYVGWKGTMNIVRLTTIQINNDRIKNCSLYLLRSCEITNLSKFLIWLEREV